MKVVKALLVLVIAAALVAAAIAGLFWKRLLSTEQKVHYGLYAEAHADYRQALRSDPDDPAALADYVDSLITMGNLGRAAYLSELYGVESKRLAGLREAVDKCLKAGAQDQAYALGEDPAVIAESGLPSREALRYLEGYQHALLGDWASAKNYFAAVDQKLLASELRPYCKYYLARSYRLAGDDEQQAKAEGLFRSLAGGQADRQLAARARYYLVELLLGDDQQGDRVLKAAGELNQIKAEDSDWALQKGYMEFSDYFFGGGDLLRAWEHAAQALLAGPQTAVGSAAAQRCFEILKQAKAEEIRELKLQPGLFKALADAGVQFGYAADSAQALVQLKGVRDLDQGQLGEAYAGLSACYLAEGDAAALGQLVESASFAAFEDEYRAAVWYNLGLQQKADQQWSGAIRSFKNAADCQTAIAPDALYEAYSVLKRVQARIDSARASAFLGQLISGYPGSEDYLKAIEELVPLTIFSGRPDEAKALCNRVLATAKDNADTTRQRTHDHAAEVANYWLAYLAEAAGDRTTAAELNAKIGTWYWNYFELTSNYPPQPQLEDQPLAIAQPEHAGEYFLGLGLTDSAQSAYEGQGREADQLYLYLDLRNREFTQAVPSLQWHATEVLESGEISEQPLLEYMLAQAYPQPYRNEVTRAAAEFNVSEALVWAVMKKESSFKPDAVSWVGAAGLMQLMPATAQWLNGRYSLQADLSRLKDPAVNIRLGAAYIRSLLDDYGENNIRAVVHTYNGGPGNYRTWRENYPCDDVLFTDVVPNEENEIYAKKVIKYYKVYDWLMSR